MTEAEAIISALAEIGIEGKVNRRGFVESTCPLASRRHASGADRNPSFGVRHTRKGTQRVGHSHCFSCGYSGAISDVIGLLAVWGDIDKPTMARALACLSDVNTKPEPLTLAVEEAGEDPLFPESWLTNFYPIGSGVPWAVTYLTQRGIRRRLVERYGILADPARGRVVVPLRDAQGKLRGAIGRAVSNDIQPRYYFYPNPDGEFAKGWTWFGENLIDPSKPVVCVEGTFDALSVAEAYPNVVAVLSTGFKVPATPWWKGVNRWITVMDTGQGGDVGRKRFDATLMRKLPHAKRWHLHPVNGKKDPGEMNVNEIKELLESLTSRRFAI